MSVPQVPYGDVYPAEFPSSIPDTAAYMRYLQDLGCRQIQERPQSSAALLPENPDSLFNSPAESGLFYSPIFNSSVPFPSSPPRICLPSLTSFGERSFLWHSPPPSPRFSPSRLSVNFLPYPTSAGSYSGKDLSPAEEVFTPLTPPEYEKKSIDYLSLPFGFECADWSIGSEHDGYFPPKFKKYMEGELKWSRLGEPHVYNDLDFCGNGELKGVRWVFFSRQDYDRPPSDDNFMDLNLASPIVRDNIRHALEEMILNTILSNSLVQFWAPIKTLEGRTLLTTRCQPFALGRTHNKIDRHRLCDYRMMCSDYKFNADAESGEDQLGLPGHVFLHKFPESTPDVKYYSKKEYPQLGDAIQCFFKGSWALPVFEGSGQTCVGVLEIASLLNMPSVWHEKSFLGHLCEIFQEFGLRIFDEYRLREMQSRYKDKASMAAFQELEMVCQSVCQIHNLPLALTWVSCNSCNDLLRSQHQFGDRDYFDYSNLFDFMEVSTVYYLRKGVVTERMLTSPNLLYCSDIQQFSITEYPLVPYARRCKLGGWFTMRLRSSYTVNEFYVLEFFLPTSSKCNENVMTTISLILGTMEEKFKTFKLASGQELGDVLSVEVLDFQNVQKSRLVQMIKATRCIPCLEPLKVGGEALQLGQLDQSSMDAINNGMNVVSEAKTDNLPSLELLQNGELAMQQDSSDQQSMDPSNIGVTRCIPSLEPLKVGGVVLQLGPLDQSSMDAINNGMNVISEAQTANLPSEPLQKGEVAMQLDSSNQQSMDPSDNGVTRCIPSIEPLQVGGGVLQLGPLDQSSMDAINNGMNVVSEAQTANLPSLVPLQNGEVAMQLDSSDRQSMNPSNNGQNVATMEQNIIVVSSPEERTRKTQEKEHNKTRVRIEVSFKDILKCSKMSRNNAARKLKVSISRFKRVCRGYGIYRWPPRKINMVGKIGRGFGIYRWPPHKINMVRKINVVRYSRNLPVEYQAQIPELPSDVPSDQASTSVADTRMAQEREHKTTGARIDVSFEDILKCSKMSRRNAARKLEVSISGLKRVCSGYGIYYWPPRKILPLEDQEQIPRLPSDEGSACVAKPGLQDANMVTIKAKYETYTLKFRLSLSSRLEDLKQEVAKRLKNLGARTYHINYEDEERELILIACDEDLQDCIHSSNNSTIVVRLSQSSQLPS